MKKLFIFFFIAVIMAFSISALDYYEPVYQDVYFDENLDFTPYTGGIYTNMIPGWAYTFSAGGGINYDYPIPSVFGGSGAGIASVAASTGYNKQKITIPLTYGEAVFEFDFSSRILTAAADEGAADGQIVINDNSDTEIFSMYISNDTIRTTLAGDGEQCIIDTSVKEPYEYHITLYIDVNQGSYTLFLDEEPTDCFDYLIDLGGPSDIQSIELRTPIISGITYNKYYDNLKFGTVKLDQTSYNDCTYPDVFCDNFNYGIPIVNYGWHVRNFDGTANDTFSPTSRTLVEEGFNPFEFFYNSLDYYELWVDYDEDTQINTYPDAPAFGISYEFNVSLGLYESFYFFNRDRQGRYCSEFRVYNESGYTGLYYNNGSNEEFYVLSNISEEKPYQLRVNYIFGDGYKAYDFDAYAENNYMDIYLFNYSDGTVQSWKNIPFDDNCVNIWTGHFERDTPNSRIQIDNYHHFVGWTETEEDIGGLFYPLYNPLDNVTQTTLSSTDPYDQIQDLFNSFGMSSSRTRYLFGALLLFIASIGLITLGSRSGMSIPFAAYGVILFCFMIIEVYLKLLPIWIVVLTALFGVIGFLLALSRRGG